MFLLILWASPKNWQVHSRLLMLPLPEYGTKKVWTEAKHSQRSLHGLQEACSCLEKGKSSLQTLEKGFEEQETCHKQPLEKGQGLEKGWQTAMGKDQENHG